MTLAEPTRYGSPGFCVARRQFNQAVPVNSWTNIAFDTNVFNDEGMFNFIDSYVTCQRAGRMFFTLSVGLRNNSGSAAYVSARLATANVNFKNSLLVLGVRDNFPNASFHMFSASIVVPVDVGSQLVPQIYFNTGGEIASGTFFEESTTFAGYYLT